MTEPYVKRFRRMGMQKAILCARENGGIVRQRNMFRGVPIAVNHQTLMSLERRKLARMFVDKDGRFAAKLLPASEVVSESAELVEWMVSRAKGGLDR